MSSLRLIRNGAGATAIRAVADELPTIPVQLRRTSARFAISTPATLTLLTTALPAGAGRPAAAQVQTCNALLNGGVFNSVVYDNNSSLAS